MNSNVCSWQGSLIMRGYFEGNKIDLSIGTARVKLLTDTTSDSPRGLPLPSCLRLCHGREVINPPVSPATSRYESSTSPYFHYLFELC